MFVSRLLTYVLPRNGDASNRVSREHAFSHLSMCTYKKPSVMTIQLDEDYLRIKLIHKIFSLQ